MNTPKHGLTLGGRGWYKRINGRPKWIVSLKVCPTADEADEHYELHFAQLWRPATTQPTPEDAQAVPIQTLCNLFLTRKKARIGSDTGISQGTYDEYEEALKLFCAHKPAEDEPSIGKTPYRDIGPAQFGSFHAELGKRFGVDRQKKFIITVRSVFKMASSPPVRLPLPDYGDAFPLPSRKHVRLARSRHKREHGIKAFDAGDIIAQIVGRWRTADEMKAEAARRAKSHRGLETRVRRKIPGASPALRAMILLAVNAGFGNTDLGELTLPIIRDALAKGWIDYERGKTGAARLAKLWPETITAIRRYLKVRPKPDGKQFADLLFVTRFGLPYVTDEKDQVVYQFGRLIKRMGQLRKGRSFYSLRRTYRSVAVEVGKELAIDLSMGHADEGDDMAKVYTVADLRGELGKIAGHVRSWLLSALKTHRTT